MERRYRRVRVLIYEGPYDWVQMSSESDNRFVRGRKVVSYREAPEAPFGEPVVVGQLLRVPDRSIEEHLCSIEEVGDGA